MTWPNSGSELMRLFTITMVLGLSACTPAELERPDAGGGDVGDVDAMVDGRDAARDTSPDAERDAGPDTRDAAPDTSLDIDAGDMGRDAAADTMDAADAAEMDAADAAPDSSPDVGDDTGSTETLFTDEAGCFFTSSEATPWAEYIVGERGTPYARVTISFDVIAGPWRPHIPDPGGLTEHILFGISRQNQPRSFQRYLAGVAAVDFISRAPHFRMYARTAIEAEVSSYTQISGTFRWAEGTRYGVSCTLDTIAHTQTCTVSEDGEVRQTREHPIDFLTPDSLSTQLRILIGA